MDLFACQRKKVANILKNFLAMLHTQFNNNVKIMRSDNGTEFVCLKNYFEEKGIYIKPQLLVLHSRIGEWNINIAIFLMWHVLCNSKLVCRLNSVESGFDSRVSH